MTDSSIFDGIDKPKRRRKRKPKQTVLWTVYHTILAVELLIIMNLIKICSLFNAPMPFSRGHVKFIPQADCSRGLA